MVKNYIRLIIWVSGVGRLGKFGNEIPASAGMTQPSGFAFLGGLFFENKIITHHPSHNNLRSILVWDSRLRGNDALRVDCVFGWLILRK